MKSDSGTIIESDLPKKYYWVAVTVFSSPLKSHTLLVLSVRLLPGYLPVIVERVQLAGQQPIVQERMRQGATEVAKFHFLRINERAAPVLCSWIRQIPGVISIEAEWL